MKLGALKGNVRRVDVVFKEEDGFEPGTMWIEYRPGELTIDVIEQIQAGMEGGSEAQAILDMMSKILVGWDLEEDTLDEAGNPTGVTQALSTDIENIRKLPLPALGFIFGAIMEDVKPNPQTPEDSEDTSQQEASQEKSLVGIS